MMSEQRLTPTERLHEVTMAAMHRAPSAPESSVTIGVTAKRLHTWEVTVRGDNPEECAKVAKRLDDELAAKFADELTDDVLATRLAQSVAK
jgi:hypothetical protein